MGDEYLSDANDVVLSFGSDVKNGLLSSAANERLKDFGINEIKRESKISVFLIFLRQFRSFIIYILIFALLISIAVKEYTDAITIFAVLLINAGFGFFQEYRAEKSIEALQRLSSLKARAIRDGELREIDAKFIVPGDIVVLRLPCLNLHLLESLPLLQKLLTKFLELLLLMTRKIWSFQELLSRQGAGYSLLLQLG